MGITEIMGDGVVDDDYMKHDAVGNFGRIGNGIFTDWDKKNSQCHNGRPRGSVADPAIFSRIRIPLFSLIWTRLVPTSLPVHYWVLMLSFIFAPPLVVLARSLKKLILTHPSVNGNRPDPDPFT